MPSRDDELRAMAEDCRRMAATADLGDALRAQLLAVGLHFDRLAEQTRLTDRIAERMIGSRAPVPSDG